MPKDLSILLATYQKQWVVDPARYRIIEKARQVGISFAEACWSVLRRTKRKIDHFYISTMEDTAQEFINHCGRWAEAFDIITEVSTVDLEDDQRAQCLTMPNGSRIMALSSHPKALRSWSGDATIDEFAFHQDQEKLYTAAQPVTQLGYHLHIISSHNGTGTVFHKMCEDAKIGIGLFKHHKVSLADAIRAGYALRIPGDHLRFLPDRKKVNEEYFRGVRASCLSEAQFDQEYMCLALSAQSLIAKSTYDKLTKEAIPDVLIYDRPFTELLVGIDVARSRDLTVIWVVDRVPNLCSRHSADRFLYRTVCVRRMRNQQAPVQYEQIKQIIAHPSVVKVAIDPSSFGRAVSDYCVNDFGSLIFPVNFTNPIKAKMAERLAGQIASNKILMPDDPLVEEDILSVRRHISNLGLITYEGRTRNSHADHFWALALALEASAVTEGSGDVYIPDSTSAPLETLEQHPTVEALRRLAEVETIDPKRNAFSERWGQQ